MSKQGQPASIRELLGDKAGKPLSLEDLPHLLGEKMPEIPFTSVGRVRLVTALHQRFGPGFMSIPGVNGIMDHFDKELKAQNIIKMNRTAQKDKQNG